MDSNIRSLTPTRSENKEKVGICPGSFDPVTNGHLDVIARANKNFDRLIVTVMTNSGKNPMFSVEERVSMLERCCKEFENVEISAYSGLLVDYAKVVGAQSIVKGLRAVSDFEYEYQMAMINRKLCPEIETIFLISSEQYSYLSSSIVKEVARYNGNISDLVPAFVEAEVKLKLK